jgi:hypothetical protein
MGSDYYAQVLAAALALGEAMRAHDRATDAKLRVGALRRKGGATQDELEVAHDNNRRARGLVMDARETLDELLLAGPEKGRTM